jgi:ELWxxDGT repeat protein
MFSKSFLRSLVSGRPRTRAKGSRRRVAYTRLFVERLEGRALPSFIAARAFDTGDTGPNSVAVGDFNGDGVQDLAVANRGTYIFYADDGSVSVHLGNGDGTFQPARHFAAGVDPVSVAVGDVNGDGRLDLAVANHGSNDVSVLLGNGDGSFQAARSFPTGIAATSVTVADFNGDGRPDLAVTGGVSAGPGVNVLLGNGDGTFQPAQYFGTVPGPRSAVAADFNRDGRLDLAVAGETGGIFPPPPSISVLLGNGDGTFQTARNFYTTGADSLSVAAGDVNGDGRLDLAVANWDVDVVSVHLGNGDGTFAAARNFAAGGPSGVALGDVNGDGRLDLAASVGWFADNNNVRVWLGNGNGTFGAAHDFVAGWQPSFVAMGEFNGDGRPDLAVAGAGAGFVSVHLGLGNGTFRAAPVLPDVWATATGDFNGDARPDVAGSASLATTADVAVALGNGNGTFGAARVFAADVGAFFVAAGDFNGDGRLDLAAANHDRNNLSVLLGDGVGRFGAAQNYAVGSGPVHIAIGDVNGDGRLDLAVANEGSSSDEGSVSMLLGNGDGTFQPARALAANHPKSVALADFNGDGRSDLAVANTGVDNQNHDGNVSVLLSNGDGTFQVPRVLAVGGYPDSVAVADVNGDGRLDLAAALGNTGAVSVFLGNGDGTFLAARNVATPGPVVVAIADVSGDGRPDLVVSSLTVRVLLGYGDGTFQSDHMSYIAAQQGALAVADFNRDGRLDVATGDGSILLNDGNWPTLPPAIRVSDVTVAEGNSGTRAATFAVTLSRTSAQPVTVSYATADGTARAGSDYLAASGTLTFAPGQTSQSVTVLVNGDRLGEANETFRVNLSAATQAIIGDDQGVGTIVDDEPRLRISDVLQQEGNTGTRPYVFTVTLSAVYDQPVTVSYQTVDGTATTSDGDYVAQSGTLTFNPGEVAKTITVAVQGDTKQEADELFYVDLFGNSSNSWYDKKRGTGTIVNDDVPSLTPRLVRDINTTPLPSNPSSLTAVGSIAYFLADDGVHGVELWKSDGTAAGTVLVKDIYPGGSSSYPVNLTNVNGLLFFSANDGSNGRELWKSDGTAAGTVMVKDIIPGPGGQDGSTLGDLTNVNGTLFFRAYDGNGAELWKSDGTTGGTVMVKDIHPGGIGFGPHDLVDVNGTLFFVDDDGTTGDELWKSDGTSAGTVLVKDIFPGSHGSYPNSSGPSSLTNVNGTLYFAADDGTHARELWKSDGTGGGTRLVKDINPSTWSGPNDLANVNGTLFFSADDGTLGRELWKSDGTATGTVLVKDIIPGSSDSNYPNYLTSVNGTLFFTIYYDGLNGVELWKSDGTTAGTALVKDLNPGNVWELTNVNGTLFFSADDGTHGRELWKSDGTVAGTLMVKDILPGSGGAVSWTSNSLTNVNGTLFFSADDGIHARELWKSNGTASGTVLVKNVNGSNLGSLSGPLVEMNGLLFFAANDGATGVGLWRSDGTAAGTVLVKGSAVPSNLTNVNGTLFFTSGWELWESDGTAAGTVLMKDTNPSHSGSYPGNLTNVSGTLFFSATDGTNGTELWKSDGTTAGTTLVKDLFPGGYSGYYGGYYLNSSSPGNLTNVNGTLFFTADDGTHGRELWKSDGTEAGTVLVKDIRPGGYGSYLSSLTNVNGTLFFTADDGTHGQELWKSAGTDAGTVLVKDVNPGAGSSPGNLTNVNGTLFFTADDGTHGTELWKSNGTAAGTVLVKDIRSGSISSSPASLTNVNSALFFSAYSDTTGRELYKSDGTAAGTTLVKDLFPGTASSSPQNLTNVNGTLYFTANCAAGASRLWRSTGTAASTARVANLFVYSLTNASGTLFFAADDGIHGKELWKLAGGTPSFPVGGITVTGGNDLPVTVRDATANGSATADSGYHAASGTLTFAPGQTSKLITVLVNGDQVGKANETFRVTLSAATRALLADRYEVGTILDDEPRLRTGDVRKQEGQSGTRQFLFTVRLSAAYDNPATVSFQTADGTATISDQDYTAQSGTLTFNPGETCKTIAILVTGDTRPEMDEQFYVEVFGNGSNAWLAKRRGIGRIVNDD